MTLDVRDLPTVLAVDIRNLQTTLKNMPEILSLVVYILY